MPTDICIILTCLNTHVVSIGQFYVVHLYPMQYKNTNNQKIIANWDTLFCENYEKAIVKMIVKKLTAIEIIISVP